MAGALVKPLSDPIIDEIHAIRAAMAKASYDDLHKIAEAARSRQAAGGRKVVILPPRRAATEAHAHARNRGGIGGDRLALAGQLCIAEALIALRDGRPAQALGLLEDNRLKLRQAVTANVMRRVGYDSIGRPSY
jgi:hypothetical protein